MVPFNILANFTINSMACYLILFILNLEYIYY